MIDQGNFFKCPFLAPNQPMNCLGGRGVSVMSLFVSQSPLMTRGDGFWSSEAQAVNREREAHCCWRWSSSQPHTLCYPHVNKKLTHSHTPSLAANLQGAAHTLPAETLSCFSSVSRSAANRICVPKVTVCLTGESWTQTAENVGAVKKHSMLTCSSGLQDHSWDETCWLVLSLSAWTFIHPFESLNKWNSFTHGKRFVSSLSFYSDLKTRIQKPCLIQITYKRNVTPSNIKVQHSLKKNPKTNTCED